MAKRIAPEILTDLKHRMDVLPARSSERREIIENAAELYGISESNIYRQLQGLREAKTIRRSDHGMPRVITKAEMEHYCELIAALKIRTSNKQGRHISTANAISLLENTGLETPDGVTKIEKGILNKSTVNRYLRQFGLDHRRMTRHSTAVSFQATHSNECWHFDLSPSALKHVQEPLWYDKNQNKKPLLMIYSIVDDRSGVCYQEYHNVYGEDVEAALRFLFNAMSAKQVASCPFQGIPDMIYMDNGPIAKSRLFCRVMEYLGITIKTHMPDSKDTRRKTARSKGKVERAFRTVKEAHEVLYHLREPQNEVEANARLFDFLKTCNDRQHRQEPHSRMEDWIANAPAHGIRGMCSWERFCTFAREAETRKVDIDARISVEGAIYEVSAEVAGETVTLWWGLFDQDLYVEYQDQRFGPYHPIEGAVPLHRYRKFAKTQRDKQQDKIEALSNVLALPSDTNTHHAEILPFTLPAPKPQSFDDPDPFHELSYLSGFVRL
ncbi:MAG: transposase family protein [Sphaerospermopsis sp. SIO1G2]|nr:transposase family protein [Sphaerospermopsis sp. SIO1G2]